MSATLASMSEVPEKEPRTIEGDQDASRRPRRVEVFSAIEPVDTRMVGLMRLVLASSALIIIFIDPSEPDRFVTVTYIALALYTAFSVLLYFRSLSHPEHPPIKYVHWIDAAWYLLLISLSSGTSSIFFFFFFFAILVASFRFGFAQGLGVTVISASLFTAIGYLTAPAGPEFELNRFLLRPIYLLVLGYMIAYWGGLEVKFKRRLAFLKEVNKLSNPRFGVDQTICTIMERLRAFYEADSCILLMSVADSPDYLMRRAERGHLEKALRAERVPSEAVAPLIAQPADQAVIYNCAKKWPPLAPRHRTYSLSKKEQGEDERREDAEAAEALADLLGGSYISIPLQTRDLSPGRFYLVCEDGSFDGSDKDFLLHVAEQVQPVVENIQLLDNLASEAAEQERQKISRDIHDSTIQPYIGFKLALESLRRKMSAGEALAGEVDDLIGMVNEGISDLRKYIRELRAKGGGSGDVLIPAIRRQAEKFAAFYGIQVEVRANGDVQVNDRLAAEVFQLVREALSNIRRHTEARHAVIALRCSDSHLYVSVENDNAQKLGQPAPFTPRSISERAASVGGRVNVGRRGDGYTVVSVEIPT